MPPRGRHREHHVVDRIGWLRAAVLGANDGIISVASLIVGVAASPATRGSLLVAGCASLVAGAMSMATGEYVSVSSQADSEQADLDREREELAEDPAGERRELALIYEARGLDPETADRVAGQLMRHDALGAHARDELGISEVVTARPVQAAVASAASFVTGAIVPVLLSVVVPRAAVLWVVGLATVVLLAVLGALGARTGGAPIGRAVVRVTFWGILAMAVTAGIGRLVGTAV